ncbi:MAG: hypothetical protein JXQ26_05940 [Tissierellales bacterium]|jgi:acetolactate synthase regulatory subunit|nr:hypothetical protein [Tissierellales bacterium]MBN2827508.1 hypothetical protein [Tissierellales bacterium]
MYRKVSFRISNGMDTAVRVLTTLRRKNFSIGEFMMTDLDGDSRLILSVSDLSSPGFEKAVLCVKKLVDVSDVMEV